MLKAMRDQFTPDIADVVVDSEDVFLRIRDFAEKLMPHMAERIKQHAMTTPLFHHFGIEKEVEALYQPKVDLPNGGDAQIEGNRYSVTGSLPLDTLRDLNVLKPDSREIIAGIYRAEFHRKPDGSIHSGWMPWVNPNTEKPDFHVPASFGVLQLVD